MRDLTVLDFPIGKENAISRTSLVLKTGLNDRTVRKQIEAMRKNGVVIMSSPQHKGYWIPKDYSEVQEYINTMESYAIRCFEAARSAKKLLSDKNQNWLGYVYSQS